MWCQIDPRWLTRIPDTCLAGQEHALLPDLIRNAPPLLDQDDGRVVLVAMLVACVCKKPYNVAMI